MGITYSVSGGNAEGYSILFENIKDLTNVQRFVDFAEHFNQESDTSDIITIEQPHPFQDLWSESAKLHYQIDCRVMEIEPRLKKKRNHKNGSSAPWFSYTFPGHKFGWITPFTGKDTLGWTIQTNRSHRVEAVKIINNCLPQLIKSTGVDGKWSKEGGSIAFRLPVKAGEETQIREVVANNIAKTWAIINNHLNQ